MKKCSKRDFFDGHKCKYVLEYWEIILKEMKTLLLYFIKFKEDNTILPKDYPNNCIVRAFNWQPIIMITYDKSTFSANNSCQKV